MPGVIATGMFRVAPKTKDAPSLGRIAPGVIVACVALFVIPCATTHAAPGSPAAQSGATASSSSRANGQSTKAPPPAGPRVIFLSDDPIGLTDRERSASKSRWEQALRPIAQREGASFFVDVNLALPPANMEEDRAYGTLAMDRLGELMKHHWQQIDGIQVFTRSDENDPTDYRYFNAHILDWLQSLSPEDRTALTQGKLPLSRVDPVTRESIVSWAINLQPSLASDLLQRGGAAGMEIAFDPMLEWQDTRTGEHRVWPIVLASPQIDVPSGMSADDPAVTPSTLPRPLDRPPPGQLDFGPGKVLELKEIIKDAEAVYGIHYDSDLRLAHATFFVNGRFSRAVLADVLKAATYIPPVAESKSHHGWWGAQRIASLLDDDFPQLLQDPLMYQPHPEDPAVPIPISSSAFQEQENATVAQIAGDTPLLQELERLGLTPDSIVQLRSGFAFLISDGGWPVGASID